VTLPDKGCVDPGEPSIPGNADILIWRSEITVSPFSSPTSLGSLVAAISSSYLSLGKYNGSNLPNHNTNEIRLMKNSNVEWYLNDSSIQNVTAKIVQHI